MKVTVQWTIDATFELPDQEDSTLDDDMVAKRKELSDEIARLLAPIRPKLGEFRHYATEVDDEDYDDGGWNCWTEG